ncbi:hypothetical protein [Microbacterium sp. SD291]|uniref:hypothetical protein n=1 Tax=Microbacterium sp. SD291 TaxID=2782007 RepID=UPI001A966B93|nr:hypothetical protein [Microbacterium sp. SD291]MBO0980276.1 hypothetical protein [Microbacterium sp. SD291]
MEWTADPSVGAWLRERLEDDSVATMHCVVPHGYEAYARVFHPAEVRSLPGRDVPSSRDWQRMPVAERDELFAQLVDSPATWAETARAFGTTMHARAQWHRIVKTPTDGDWRTRAAPDGREFTSPEEGRMPPALLAGLAAHLVAHTTTPDDGCAALWEGWGGLLGFSAGAPSRSPLTAGDDPIHQEMLGRSIHDPFNNVFRKPVWHDGILSREISEGPRLVLPGREHVLFTAAPRAFDDPDWVLDAPWRDRPMEQHGFAPQAQHPSLIWPADRAWVMVSEIDFDSTIVAGSADLIRTLCADDRLEALPLAEGSSLTWDSDEVNR